MGWSEKNKKIKSPWPPGCVARADLILLTQSYSASLNFEKLFCTVGRSTG